VDDFCFGAAVIHAVKFQVYFTLKLRWRKAEMSQISQ
jgi:hypothetical protein